MDNETKERPPLIPVRMLNEYVYCPRLAYMMWVQGEFAHSADTVEGAIRHKRVDKESGKLPVNPEIEPEEIHARSVSLSSESLGITAKIDLVEGVGTEVQPVDYKKGKRPHVPAGAYAPERVQVCAQGLLLREHGYQSDHGFLCFIGSKDRVKVVFDEALIAETLEAAQRFRAISLKDVLPPPLVDSPKCGRCSLIGICLPDEFGLLTHQLREIRPISPRLEAALPLYVQSPASYVKKYGEQLIIEENQERQAEARLMGTSQVVLFGHCGISAPEPTSSASLAVTKKHPEKSNDFSGLMDFRKIFENTMVPKRSLELLKDYFTPIRRGRSGQGSLPCSTPRQSRPQTSPVNPRCHRLPREHEARSLNRR